MTVSRLRVADPELEEAYSAATDEARIVAARETARAAVRLSGVNDAAVLAALDKGSSTDVAAVVEGLDQRYFQLEEEEGRSVQSLRLFSQARAAAAVQFVQSGKPAESLYEAICSTGNPQLLRMVAFGFLRGAAV
ncbi:hypothetical protein C7S18_06035 [Ahniella affigens]|uniref:Uncharacterized protein n=1 Tax=Ahniella affigens TaxID=2021234 RepID=A0A2P1PPM9_9GAMM|nr:hypothetical protein [Ahniella affigens]AVP96784.1 hypothetical protein C7S18_06035 [Ahniella affigens]